MGTILLAGIYGVGKSTLAQNLSRKMNIPYFSAGDLISAVNGEKYGANKMVQDKDKNQDILADSVTELLGGYERILLAGHFCIVNQKGQVDALPSQIFSKLQIEKIVLLEADPEIIMSHLTTRDGKQYSRTLIDELSTRERALAKSTGRMLNCPIIIHQMTYDENDLIRLLAKL